jgi:hypothetical protein
MRVFPVMGNFVEVHAKRFFSAAELFTEAAGSNSSGLSSLL